MPGTPPTPRLITKHNTEAAMRTEDHPAVSGEASANDLAHRFTAALATRDAAMLRSLFGSEVDFRALTPGRLWEADTPDALINDVILGSWFEPSDVIQRIESVQHGQVGTRTRIGYRLRVQNPSGTFTVEQQAFCDLTDGKITWLRVLCSGFVPLAETDARAAVGGQDAQLEGRRS
jgi:hypothetical protein